MENLIRFWLLCSFSFTVFLLPVNSFGNGKFPKGCAKWSYDRVMSAAKPYLSVIKKRTQNSVISPELVTAVITSESCFNHKARSHAGALGLMQLMPATASRFAVTDRLSATQSIHGGVQYLEFLSNKFNKLELVIAGYNAGEGSVMKYGGVPPYRETKQYLINVLHVYRMLKNRGGTHSDDQASIDAEISGVNEKDLFRTDLNLAERVNGELVGQTNGFVKWKASPMAGALSGFK